MALSNYEQQSFFRNVFDPQKDFHWNMPFEIPESLQMQFDPVGFFYFHREIVHELLNELRFINKRRTDLRDLLREMGQIWRFNNQQHILLNEADWTSANDVARRVQDLVKITRVKLHLEERVNNLVTGEIIKHWENYNPTQNPVLTAEKMSSTLRMRVPHIDSTFTPNPFRHVTAFNKNIK